MMRPAAGVLLISFALVAMLIFACFQTVPGYMDAEYYLVQAIKIVDGSGIVEPYLWNYLDSPLGIPHPAFAYWMPLTSLVAALGMFLLGNDSFFAARLGFLLFAAILPYLVYKLCELLGGNSRLCWTAGAFSIFSGFYAVVITVTDSFAILMILGCLYLLLAFNESLFDPGWKRNLGYLGMGLLAGLFHLARADGFLWLFGGIGILIWRFCCEYKRKLVGKRRKLVLQYLVYFFVILLGYCLIMFWWYQRNLAYWGSLLPPGGSLTLWLTDYNQTYTFPVTELNFASWYASGWNAILGARLDALWLNLKTFLGVQMQVFLFPFVLIGAWKLRKNPRVVFGLSMWLAIFLVMTFIFPFSGSRGGFFHSGAAIQPLFWGLFPIGFMTVIQWGVRKRNWHPQVSLKVFSTALLGVALIMTIVIFYSRVIGTNLGEMNWESSFQRYKLVDAALIEIGIQSDAIIVVNNPPGFFLATGRRSIVIPDGNVSTLVNAARKYGADILVLEPDHPDGLEPLYQTPEIFSSLQWLGTEDNIHIFRIP